MSLFSGECQELAPCAVPVRQKGDNKYGISTTTSVQTHQHQSENSASRKSSTPASEADNDNNVAEKKESLGENKTGPTEGGEGEEEEGGQNDDSKIVPAPLSSVTR